MCSSDLVSRQFGSGGHKIAEALAEHFELPIYDHRMLDSIAKEKGVDPRVLEKYDEKPLNRFLARNVSGFSSSLENNLAQMQFSYLKDKADSGESFVVVGRCAETVLKEYDGLITIFVLFILARSPIVRISSFSNTSTLALPAI